MRPHFRAFCQVHQTVSYNQCITCGCHMWLMLYTWLASPVAVCIDIPRRYTRLAWLAVCIASVKMEWSRICIPQNWHCQFLTFSSSKPTMDPLSTVQYSTASCCASACFSGMHCKWKCAPISLLRVLNDLAMASGPCSEFPVLIFVNYWQNKQPAEAKKRQPSWHI